MDLAWPFRVYLPLELEPSRKWSRTVIIAATAIVLAGYSVTVLRLGMGHDSLFGFAAFFDLARENNLPTWFSSSVMLMCALMLWCISAKRKADGDRDATLWTVLAIGLVYLSLDETGQIHERLAIGLRSTIQGPGIFNYGWVFAIGLPAVAVVGLTFLGFLRRLPSRTRRWFLFSAAIYLGGVLGFEALAGLADFEVGRNTLAYEGLTLVEETLEIFGMVFFFVEVERTLRASASHELARLRMAA